LDSVLFLCGDFTGAADAFRRSVEIAPTSEGYSNTGTNYSYAGRYHEALAMFEKATGFPPEDFQLWGNLDHAHWRNSESPEQARGAYQRASELARANLVVNSESVVTRAALAYFLIRLGNHSDAATKIATAQATGSGDVYAHYYAALVLKDLGDDRRAIAETRRAREAGYPASLLRGEPEFAPVIRRQEIAALVRETGN
jgi:tetratricopeptide (TPR) repeat protein